MSSQYENCTISPSYNYKGKSSIYCATHKLENMITSKSVYCKESDCISIASFGIPGKQVSYCSKHRQPGTIRNSNAKCKNKKCRTILLRNVN